MRRVSSRILFLARAYARTCTHARARTCTHTRTCTHPRARIHVHALTCTHPHICPHATPPSLVFSFSLSLARSLTHSFSLALSRSLSLSFFLALSCSHALKQRGLILRSSPLLKRSALPPLPTTSIQLYVFLGLPRSLALSLSCEYSVGSICDA